jgi:hypothetical protein
MLRFRNENSLTLRFEYDFGESEWFATVNQQPAGSDAYLVSSCLFARTGEWPGDGSWLCPTDSQTTNDSKRLIRTGFT